MKMRSIMFVVILIILFSCTSGPTVPNLVTDLFADGSNERSLIVVISDFHLGADLHYAEIRKNLKPLANFLEKVRVSPNIKELVIAGDLLDEWFVPANADTYNGKDQYDFVQRIAAANKGVIDAFNRIIKEGKILVTYVPGNHDLTITADNVASIFPEINQARDAELGLGTYAPVGHPEIAIEHGHRYNFFCAPDPISNQAIAPGSIMPPGYFFTRIATLHVEQKCKTAGDMLPVVTPNITGGINQDLAFIYWNIWKTLILSYPIEDKFSDKIIVTDIDGFTGKYSINDLIPFQLSAGGFIDMYLYKGIQDPDTWRLRQKLNKVAVDIPVAQAIANAANVDESDNQAKVQYFMNRNSDTRIVIFGHTHEAKIISSVNYKGQKSIYANSGTWIDKPNYPDSFCSFVVITPQNADVSSRAYVKLYNFKDEVAEEIAMDSLRLLAKE